MWGGETEIDGGEDAVEGTGAEAEEECAEGDDGGEEEHAEGGEGGFGVGEEEEEGLEEVADKATRGTGGALGVGEFAGGDGDGGAVAEEKEERGEEEEDGSGGAGGFVAGGVDNNEDEGREEEEEVAGGPEGGSDAVLEAFEDGFQAEEGEEEGHSCAGDVAVFGGVDRREGLCGEFWEAELGFALGAGEEGAGEFVAEHVGEVAGWADGVDRHGSLLRVANSTHMRNRPGLTSAQKGCR